MAIKITSRKAQVTIFIIIGILLLLAVSLIYLFQVIKVGEDESRAKDVFTSTSSQAKSMVESCVYRAGYDAMSTVALNGGYAEIPESIRYYGTSLWYRKQVNIQPSLEDFGKSLKDYFDSNVRDCINLSEFEHQGYNIITEDPDSEFIFGINDVTLKVSMPVKISSGNLDTSFNDFSAEYPLRLRKMWELSSKYVNRFLEPDFNTSSPLEAVDAGDFIVTTEMPEPNNLIYKIVDSKEYVLGQNNFTFRFSYSESDSPIQRTYELQQDYETIPIYFPRVEYSLDRNAHLIILPGTTFTDPIGRGEITVVQDYPHTVTGYNLPQTNIFNESVTPPVFNKTWNLSNPVYDFSPTGLASSQPMDLNLYWDYSKNPKHGDLGILTNHSGYWHAIPSRPNNKQGFATAQVDGFSGFTLVDCEVQNISASFSLSPLLPFTYLGSGGGASTIPSGSVDLMTSQVSTINPTNPSLESAYYLPIIMTITLPGLEDKIALLCVDFTPTCDTIVALVEADLKSYGSCQVVPPFNDVPILAQIMPVVGTLTQTLSGLTILSSLDTTSSEFYGQEQEEFEADDLATYATIALQDLGKEFLGFNLGGQLVNITDASNITTTSIKISFVYLQGGTTYKLCSVTKGCTVGQQCLTICGAVYP